MDKSKIKNILLIVLVVGLIGMTVSYAAMSQRLNIKSTAKVKASTWDVHFENLSQGIIVGTGNIIKNPVLSNTSIKNLDVELQKPGDSVSYTFDIKNAGTIAAKIGEYKVNTSADGIICTDQSGNTDSADSTLVCNNLKYTFTYAETTKVEQTNSVISSGTTIKENQELNPGEKVKVKLTIEYNSDKALSSDVAITGLDAYMIYIQK